MHILLTDHLICSRCGPGHGLILLADRLEERRVLEGRLGCPNCRQEYPITRGVADLRLPGAGALPLGAAPEFDEERAFRAAALLGVTTPNSTLLVLEPHGRLPGLVAAHLPGVHVVGISSLPPAEPAEVPGEGGVLSSLRAGVPLPLRSGSLAGVALLDAATPEVVREAVRLLAPGARLLLDPAAPGEGARLQELGLTVQLEQQGVAVAAAPGPG